MNEKPLERLNYFNGQRLQAADFKLEQDYHVRVRRWLNRSLYTPGIASGLEVYRIAGAPRVKILPGLAIDHLGREIILLEELDFPVMGHGGGGTGACRGPYLTIRYQEDLVSQQDACCAVGGEGASKPAWGGPARILAEPVLELNADLPHPSSGKIPLACLTLAKGCGSVDVVDTSVRRYVGDASNAKVKQYALEGVREVAAIPAPGGGAPVTVKAKVLFHVRGRQPNTVTLYLKARQFSPLRYTELGAHTHGLTVSGATGESNPELNATHSSHGHDHGTLAATAGTGPEHAHNLTGRMGYIGQAGPHDNGKAAFFLIERNWGVKLGLPENTDNTAGNIGATLANFFANSFQPVWAPEIDSNTNENILAAVAGTINGGGHPIAGTTDSNGPDLRHTHSISGSGTSDLTGATDPNSAAVVARAGETLQYVYDLRVAIDGVDKTNDIKEQITNSAPENEAGDWALLGDGLDTHPLADEKRDAIAVKVDYLPGVVLDEGEHSIEFSVGLKGKKANGGLVQFNLYVE